MLSVIIITKNEAANIKRCLESVAFADQIIVLDSGSTDDTPEIASNYTENVYITPDWQGYGIQKQRALAMATGDWVLNLDADESVNNVLKDEIIKAIASNQADAYRMPICMNFYGKAMRHSSSPKRHVRLFKREGARFSDDIVHEKILLPESARIGKLSEPIMHHSYQDVSHALAKMNRYSSYTARTRLAKRSGTPSFMQAIMSAGWMFFRCYILQRGFLEGREGYLLAVFNAEGAFYRAVKQIFPDRQIHDLPTTKKTEAS